MSDVITFALDTCTLDNLIKAYNKTKYEKLSVLLDNAKFEYEKQNKYMFTKYGKYYLTNKFDYYEVKQQMAQSNFSKLKELREDYRIFYNIQDQYNMFQLIKYKLDGKYNYVATDMVLCEFENMYDTKIKSKEAIAKERKKLYSNLDELVQIDTFLDDKVCKRVDELAKDYRNVKNKHLEIGQSPIPNQVGALGLYGDSIVMSQANILGYNLITNNGADYIFDKSYNIKNEFRRNYVKSVNKSNKYATDALPYSPQEIVEGKFTLPKEASCVKEVETEFLTELYNNPNEIIMN